MNFKSIFFAGLSITTLCFIASPLPASASVNQGGMEKDGYSCSPISGSMPPTDSCTKSGSPTYECSTVCIRVPGTKIIQNTQEVKFIDFLGKGQPQVKKGK
jgi:hypothetical protein